MVYAILLVAIISLTACGHIQDSNGASTELVSISTEKLTAKSISHTTSGVSKVSSRNHITIVTQHEDIDVDSLSLSGGKTSGVSNIMATQLELGQTLKINSQSSVNTGNLGMILISPDNEILHKFIIGQEDSCEITAKKKGIYMVRTGTESFSGEIKLERIIS